MDLAAEIQGALTKQASLQTLREIVCRYKHSGGTQQAAYATLEKIRQEQVEESYEDLVLELMDFVAGFCSKEQRIWEEVLVN
jgi:hypothetical protein